MPKWLNLSSRRKDPYPRRTRPGGEDLVEQQTQPLQQQGPLPPPPPPPLQPRPHQLPQKAVIQPAGQPPQEPPKGPRIQPLLPSHMNAPVIAPQAEHPRYVLYHKCRRLASLSVTLNHIAHGAANNISKDHVLRSAAKDGRGVLEDIKVLVHDVATAIDRDCGKRGPYSPIRQLLNNTIREELMPH